MTTLARSASLLAARTSLALVVLSFAILGAWTASDLLGQPSAQKKERVEEEEDAPKAKAPSGQKKRVEEEEEAPRKQKKGKVIRVDEEDDGKPKAEKGRPAAAAANASLTQLADEAKHPALKELFRSLSVPHDRVLRKRSSITVNNERKQDSWNVEPIPFYLGNDPGRYRHERLSFTRLTLDWKPEKPSSLDPIVLESVRPYEEIAQDEVGSFLKKEYDKREPNDPLYLSRYAMLTAGEQVLSSVLNDHQSFIQTGKRSGKDWDQVEKQLREQLLLVMVDQMKELARAKDWDRVLDLMHRLAASYGNSDERIFRPVVDMLKQALAFSNATNDAEEKRKTFKRLHDLGMEFPNNPAFQPLSKLLEAHAQDLLNRATELARDKEDAKKLQTARECLKEAEETWPQLEGLGVLRAQIGRDYPILRVGVRGPLPQFFSPAWACTDNERRVVELLFESLIKLVPDQSGGFRYRPALAESPPKVVALGRQFDLPFNAFWSDQKPLMASDVRESLKHVKDGKGVGLSRVWGDLLEDKIESMKNPFQLALKMKQGFLDPLAPMSYKILPRDLHILSKEFALNPVTSGPFSLDRLRSGQSDETKRSALFFVANPVYSQRPTKQGTPHIQEIRFYSYADNTDLAKEVRNHNLDLILDLTVKQVEELRKAESQDIVVPLPSPSVPNRRIYFLAINTKKLEDPKLRQALSFAIDREALLKDHFRGSLPGLHKVLNGPFPAGSWACKPVKDVGKDSQSLFDPERAKLQKPSGRVRSFQLKYAAESPAVDDAMKSLCEQVKKLTGVVLEPTRCTPYQLRDDVEKSQDYDLAYYHYDFPDEIYWLAPLFGPPPGMGDFNIFKYTNSKLSELLGETKNHRNFVTFQECQWSIQDLLYDEMPFIPLWQLDPLLAYRRNVEPTALDPWRVFDNIEEWHLLPR